MTTLETSLNTAHKFQRKADVFLKSGKYKEAILCHQKAAEFVSEAMSTTQSERAKESLQLQRDFHLRQQAVVQYKQQRNEALKKAQEKNKAFGVKSGECYAPNYLNAERSPENILAAIQKLMGEHDSLLENILTDCQQLNEASEETLSSSRDLTESVQCGKKFPKDLHAKIEELLINKEELKKLVKRLVLENEMLQRRVDELEQYIAGNSGRRMTLLADGESPYVCSPYSDLSPGLRELPQLAPLELPKFDFNSMKTTK